MNGLKIFASSFILTFTLGCSGATAPSFEKELTGKTWTRHTGTAELDYTFSKTKMIMTVQDQNFEVAIAGVDDAKRMFVLSTQGYFSPMWWESGPEGSIQLSRTAASRKYTTMAEAFQAAKPAEMYELRLKGERPNDD